MSLRRVHCMHSRYCKKLHLCASEIYDCISCCVLTGAYIEYVLYSWTEVIVTALNIKVDFWMLCNSSRSRKMSLSQWYPLVICILSSLKLPFIIYWSRSGQDQVQKWHLNSQSGYDSSSIHVRFTVVSSWDGFTLSPTQVSSSGLFCLILSVLSTDLVWFP